MAGGGGNYVEQYCSLLALIYTHISNVYYYVQHFGLSTIKFMLSFNIHKSHFRVHSRLSVDDKDKDDLIYRPLWP